MTQENNTMPTWNHSYTEYKMGNGNVLAQIPDEVFDFYFSYDKRSGILRRIRNNDGSIVPTRSRKAITFQAKLVDSNGDTAMYRASRMIYNRYVGNIPNNMGIKFRDSNNTNFRLDNIYVDTTGIKSSTGEKYIQVNGNRYQVGIFINGKNIHFGTYCTVEEAIPVRDFVIARLGITDDTNNVATDAEIDAVRQELEVMARNRVNMTPVDTLNPVPVAAGDVEMTEAYDGSSATTETNVEAPDVEYTDGEFAPITLGKDGKYSANIEVSGKSVSIGRYGNISDAANALGSIRY